MSAVSGQDLARLTAHTLEKLRSNESFNQFYDSVIKKKERLSMVYELKLPRKWNKPNYVNIQQTDDGNHGEACHPVTAKEKCLWIYYEVIDLVIENIKESFEQE